MCKKTKFNGCGALTCALNDVGYCRSNIIFLNHAGKCALFTVDENKAAAEMEKESRLDSMARRIQEEQEKAATDTMPQIKGFCAEEEIK